MIRVLLVDDELLSRMTVRSLINWEKEGYTICGECSDGTQAWAAIPSLRPQIVITDVKMNRMNGDELVRRIAWSIRKSAPLFSAAMMITNM